MVVIIPDLLSHGWRGTAFGASKSHKNGKPEKALSLA